MKNQYEKKNVIDKEVPNSLGNNTLNPKSNEIYNGYLIRTEKTYSDKYAKKIPYETKEKAVADFKKIKGDEAQIYGLNLNTKDNMAISYKENYNVDKNEKTTYKLVKDKNSDKYYIYENKTEI